MTKILHSRCASQPGVNFSRSIFLFLLLFVIVRRYESSYSKSTFPWKLFICYSPRADEHSKKPLEVYHQPTRGFRIFRKIGFWDPKIEKRLFVSKWTEMIKNNIINFVWVYFSSFRGSRKFQWSDISCWIMWSNVITLFLNPYSWNLKKTTS